MTPPTTVSVCGSTGSIGTQTLEVVAAEPDRFRVVALGAASSVDQLAEQAQALHPDVVAIADETRVGELAARVPPGTEVTAGSGALAEVAGIADVCVNGVVGFAGLPVTLGALEAGRRLALANKESLIAAGPLVQATLRVGGGEIVPVDSEHCAVHQCLAAGPRDRVARVVLTASGGPFRGRRLDELERVTVADALAHPTWSMGPKITVDSSTLMNKGLEVIEATELFALAVEEVGVVVHPQSIVHSMVEFTDGAVLAQLGGPDMRTCIGYALSYPDRLATSFDDLSLPRVGALTFEEPDLGTFRCLALAFDAARAGGSAPTWLNAANEVAVEAFLSGRLPWTGIGEVVAGALDSHEGTNLDGADVVIDVDRRARDTAHRVIERRSAA